MCDMQHCDKVIAEEYPEMSDKAKGRTVFNALVITSDKVELIMAEMKSWTVNMDKSVVSVCVRVSVGCVHV